MRKKLPGHQKLFKIIFFVTYLLSHSISHRNMTIKIHTAWKYALIKLSRQNKRIESGIFSISLAFRFNQKARQCRMHITRIQAWRDFAFFTLHTSSRLITRFTGCILENSIDKALCPCSSGPSQFISLLAQPLLCIYPYTLVKARNTKRGGGKPSKMRH